jgi:FixJ family two-component response regulator
MSVAALREKAVAALATPSPSHAEHYKKMRALAFTPEAAGKSAKVIAAGLEVAEETVQRWRRKRKKR